MKILMLTDRMNAGGAETHIAMLCLGLQQMGVETAVLSGGGAIADELELAGIRQIRVPLPTHRLWRLIQIRRMIKKLIRTEGFDVLHAHARIPALLLRGLHGSARIVTAHARFYRNSFLSRICYWGERTIAVSEDLRAELCDGYGIAAESIRVIPNGIDCDKFSPPSEESTDGTVRILFASRLEASCARGADLLLSAARELYHTFPNIRIGIAGGGSEYHRLCEDVKALNRMFGNEIVTLHGEIRDMPNLLRNTDIFVGVSRAAMEAAACGCAVILCGNEGYLGILNRQNAEYASLSNFCARGEEAAKHELLLRDLRLLLENPALRRTYADECHAWITSHFGAKQICRQTLALYHRVCTPVSHASLVAAGYFGCGNLGDDAILLGFLEAMHDRCPEIRITALTGNPRRDSRRFAVRCIARRNPFALWWALLRARAFLCGGGSLLQNITSNRSLAYYLSLLRRARHMGVPVLFYAAGVGPLINPTACRRVAKSLQGCRYISLRDRDSMHLLRALGVDPAQLHEGADPALLMPQPPHSRAPMLLRSCGIAQGRRYLCVVLRGGSDSALLRATLLAALRPLCHRHGLCPLFLIFDEKHDGKATRAAARQQGGKLARLREPADAAALFAQSEGVISMRLHALILAAAVGTPALGIPADTRDHKIASFAKESGQEVLDSPSICLSDIVDAAEKMLSNRAARRRILASSVADMRKKARKDLENIAEMIYNSDNCNETVKKGDSHEKRTACRPFASDRF